MIVNLRPPRIAMFLSAVAAITHIGTPIGNARLVASVLVAGGIAVAGFVVMTWAWWQFRTEQVAICPTETTDHLISGGIYRLTRNPMYLGMTSMLLGLALFIGTLPFYVSTVVFFLTMNAVFCPYEEAKLEHAFGQEFVAYARRVRRWI